MQANSVRLSTEDFPVSSTVLESSRLGNYPLPMKFGGHDWQNCHRLSSGDTIPRQRSGQRTRPLTAGHHRRGRSMSPRGGIKTRKFFQSQQQQSQYLRILQGTGLPGTKRWQENVSVSLCVQKWTSCRCARLQREPIKRTSRCSCVS